MTPAVQNLFNRLTDGLAIIAPDATVRFFNESMQMFVAVGLGRQFPLTAVAALIDQALAGHLALPHRFETILAHDPQIADPDLLVGHIVRSPVGSDLVVVLHDVTEAKTYGAAIENLSALVDQNLREPFERFGDELSSLLDALAAPSTTSLAVQKEELVDRGRTLLRQLRSLCDFVTLARGNRLDASDRIEVGDWLTRLLGEQMAEAKRRGIRVTFAAAKGELPVVYGSRHWLSEALRACIDNAIRHSDNGSEIVVIASALERFVRIDARNHGRQLRSPMLRNRLARPLMRGKAADQSSIGLGLGLPLARTIIEAHSGRLALEQDLEGFVTCRIELPAGSTPHVQKDLHEVQTLRYARDLARLMSMRTNSVVSRTDSTLPPSTRG